MRNFRPIVVAALLAASVPARTGPLAATQAASQAPAQVVSYDPAGRRDPFKNLLAGKDLTERRVITGLSDLLIDEITIIGLVKAGGRFEAVIGLNSGFPMTAHEGDRLADGYVLSIQDKEIVLRKTKERGIPLLKPKDIVKEITPEER
jgi:Tfp pilus assembly protein PilP